MKRLALCGVMAVAVWLAGAPAHAAVSLTSGHVDAIDVNWAGGGFTVKVLDETVSPAVERDPADVTLHAPAAARTTVPSGAKWAFLGSAGAPVWILPQSQNPSLLWLGWNTAGVPSGALQGNSLQLKVTAVSGPDGFSVYQVGALGQVTVLFDSENGLPDSRALSAGSHGHANWAFEAAGTYTVTVEVTGVRAADGAAVSSGPIPYTFAVTN